MKGTEKIPIEFDKNEKKNAFSFLILLSPTKRDEKYRQKQKRVFEKLFLSKTKNEH